jgi:endonuclease/exonuclease/phosphatase family metal-dependent hydrolase
VFTVTGEKMRRSITRRPKQVNKVFDDIEDCPVEAFVCGDFNDNPTSYTYYRMMRDRQDTFVEAGNGFGATYSLMWPLLRIDYILCPKSAQIISHETPHVRLSDHYPVISELVL